MKRIIISLFACLAYFTSCEETFTNPYAKVEFKVSQDTILCDVTEQIKTIKVQASEQWILDQQDVASWCVLEKIDKFPDNMLGAPGYVTAYISANAGLKERQTYFIVIDGDQSKKVLVRQLGTEPCVLSNKDLVTVGKEELIVPILLVSNIEITLTPEKSWIDVIAGYTDNETPVKVRLQENTTGAERSAKLVIKQKDGEYTRSITFTQTANTGAYEPEDVESIKGNHQLVITGANSSEAIEGKGIDKTYDGSVQSHFQSAIVLKPATAYLEYSFTDESSLAYFIFTQYGGEIANMPKSVKISVKCNDAEYVDDQTIMFNNMTAPQGVALTKIYQNPESIKLEVISNYSATNEKYFTAACSEIAFYSSDMEYENIFKDKTYSELVAGVTLDQIAQIADPFYLNIAQHLYNNTYSMGRINDYPSYPLVSMHRSMPNSYFGLLDNATGISVKAGEEIVVFCDDFKSKAVSLVLMNPKTTKTFSDPKEFPLYEGVNKLKMTSDGHLYVKNQLSVDPIRVHIAGGTLNGHYDSQKHSLAEGQAQLNGATSEFFDIKGKYAQLVLPTAVLKDNAQHLQTLIDNYDLLISSQQDFLGVTKYNLQMKNKMCFVATDAEFKDNEFYYVFLPLKNIADYCTNGKITPDALWNLSTRVSYILQHKAWQWTNLKVTSCALPALYTQEAFGLTNKLKAENTYVKAYQKFLIEGAVYDMVPDCDEKLVPLWQLYLYLTKIQNKPEMFMDIHNAFRTANTAGMQTTAVPVIANTAGVDFTTFFKDWGFTTTGPTTATVKAPLGLRYLTDSNIEAFKKPVVAATGKYTISGLQVTVTNPRNVIAYEIYIKGSLAQVVPGGAAKFVLNENNRLMKIFAIGVNNEIEVLLK